MINKNVALNFNERRNVRKFCTQKHSVQQKLACKMTQREQSLICDIQIQNIL